MNPRTIALLAALAFAAPSASAATAPTSSKSAPKPAAKKAVPKGNPTAKAVLPFIHDDYAKALAEAKAKHVPVFVEAWAPWCHTCRSMQSYVFTDEKLRPQSDKFVWLAVDYENAKNAPFLKRYPIPALPTFLVIDPSDESVAMRWVGGATLPQMQGFLADASADGGADPTAVDEALARGDRAYGDQKYDAAVASYRAALGSAPPDWPTRGRVVEAMLYALSQLDSTEATLRFVEEVLPEFRGTPTGISATASGMAAATQLPKEDPRRQELETRYEADLRKMLADPSIAISGDDRSGYMIMLLDARTEMGDSLGAKQTAEEWSAALDQSAAAAKTPQQRAVYDSHRLSAYNEIGHPERALPMLLQSKKDFPDDYNPDARLALAYKYMKRWDDALKSSDAALGKVYGPRKLTVYNARADIFEGKGDVAGATKVIEQALGYAEALPEGQRSQRSIDSLKKRLEKLTTTATAK